MRYEQLFLQMKEAHVRYEQLFHVRYEQLFLQMKEAHVRYERSKLCTVFSK